ncbi:hypothetical protein K438DRAFT_1772700 [Mycena galopus ATCC 62051]|nr:hypothetical protein K438DRAFT_1772700 [Mycena galopus ATCC 62051]
MAHSAQLQLTKQRTPGASNNEITVPGDVGMVHKYPEAWSEQRTRREVNPGAGITFPVGQVNKQQREKFQEKGSSGEPSIQQEPTVMGALIASSAQISEELDPKNNFYEKSCLRGSANATSIVGHHRQFEVIGGIGYVDKTKWRVIVKSQSFKGCCGQRGADVVEEKES